MQWLWHTVAYTGAMHLANTSGDFPRCLCQRKLGVNGALLLFGCKKQWSTLNDRSYYASHYPWQHSVIFTLKPSQGKVKGNQRVCIILLSKSSYNQGGRKCMMVVLSYLITTIAVKSMAFVLHTATTPPKCVRNIEKTALQPLRICHLGKVTEVLSKSCAICYGEFPCFPPTITFKVAQPPHLLY